MFSVLSAQATISNIAQLLILDMVGKSKKFQGPCLHGVSVWERRMQYSMSATPLWTSSTSKVRPTLSMNRMQIAFCSRINTTLKRSVHIHSEMLTWLRFLQSVIVRAGFCILGEGEMKWCGAAGDRKDVTVSKASFRENNASLENIIDR
jgi:hypothetical protein